jgi:16S rRNA (guanine(1405)-N(7))-methyltransferase
MATSSVNHGRADVPPRQQVVAALRASRKYADLCPQTLERVADWALDRHCGATEAVKAAKRKLHQVYGSYISRAPRKVEPLVARVDPGDPAQCCRVCREILKGHASTAERAAFLPELYAELFAITGKPRSVLDLACGFHPFALPWMHLAPGTRYIAIDIDGWLVRLIDAFLGRLGFDADARCSDVLARPIPDAVDVAFVLKCLPCLEQQEKGVAVRLLASIQARHLVVSYPTRSLGGKRKGMDQHYGALMADIAKALDRPFTQVRFPGEVFYVVDTAARRSHSS